MTDHQIPAPVPLRATTDPEHGGRWTSLLGGGREWLWHRAEPGRPGVRPGGAFTDAGGLEECLPTVRGTPDHGDAWSRPWHRTPLGNRDSTDTVQCSDFTLARTLSHSGGAVIADYRLAADPGYRFLWAAHALLELSVQARIDAPAGTATRIWPEAARYLEHPWPAGARWVEGHWPAPAGLPLDTLGPDDGTAVGAVLAGHLPGRALARVVDGPDELRLLLEADGQPVSVALWRNLGGWPETGPYRSVGVEPMLGRVFDLAEAGPEDAAVVPAAGEVHWRLTLTAARRHPERN